MKNIITPITVFTFGLFLDIYTKHLANKHLRKGTDFIVYKKLKLRLAKNKGAMLNSFSNHRKFLLFANLIIFLFLFKFIKISFVENNLINLVALAIILSGGVGNNLERLTKKEVTDFLFLDYKKLPIFNIADFLVYIGTVTLLFNNRNL